MSLNVSASRVWSWLTGLDNLSGKNLLLRRQKLDHLQEKRRFYLENLVICIKDKSVLTNPKTFWLDFNISRISLGLRAKCEVSESEVLSYEMSLLNILLIQTLIFKFRKKLQNCVEAVIAFVCTNCKWQRLRALLQ